MCIYFPDLLLVCGCPDCGVCVDRELPFPPPTTISARDMRWRKLLASRHFVAVAIEAPLADTPVIRSA
ncbi:hypothetical protein [Bradyrhizobium diazoefficiens]|uniref:Uncharacterized protein n=1 Tax=Bradyrhizobium diazoefficiens TaxID=1355477 RepID=A0A0E3VWZ4_9BRAD|nr:hypothetical protein [Bradyrhizobium diazoefficiens]BAR61765.1 hypothetical protein NK6_8616 [Bradyrhizobium diazoefficiens]BCA04049.1 hypothetical protein H12S4_49530 [Bradyrhizobium diazoefficiens]BCA21408.1 hypothetical protein BDHH15_46230 [Bradyrhizobium diazoefficiens]BCE39576.1 hypothetical protein XF3B_46070 [Bradyrhizobium diazoefficiens]BCF52973.1 hypothetical protein XF17B_46110 [Bradyrhizobium diazoefficiens]